MTPLSSVSKPVRKWKRKEKDSLMYKQESGCSVDAFPLLSHTSSTLLPVHKWVSFLSSFTFLLALTLTMKESFEMSDYRSEHKFFTTAPFLSEVNKGPIVSIKLCVWSQFKGLCYPNHYRNCMNFKKIKSLCKECRCLKVAHMNSFPDCHVSDRFILADHQTCRGLGEGHSGKSTHVHRRRKVNSGQQLSKRQELLASVKMGGRASEEIDR